MNPLIQLQLAYVTCAPTAHFKETILKNYHIQVGYLSVSIDK